jgi:membrane protein implicated in regulation of membrane protease activity
MPNWSPPRVSQPALIIAISAYSLFLGYAVLIAGQFLLGVLVGLSFALLYLLWRILAAVEAVAEATQRLADRQADSDGGDRGADAPYEDENPTD